MNHGPYGQPPPIEERLRVLPQPPRKAVQEVGERNRKLNVLLVFAAAAVAIALMVAAFAWSTRGDLTSRADRNQQTAERADQKAMDASAQASAAVEAAKEANRRLKAAGKPTVPVPTVPTVAPVTIFPPVTTGLTSDQIESVRSLISSQLASYRLPPAAVSQIATAAAALVPKPKDGHTPTAAELKPLAVAAQAAYCADGKCIPKPGANGTVGPSGPPGPAGPTGSPGQDGKDAPPLTSEQIKPIVTEAFTAYCAQPGEPCRGERGAQGDEGETGRGIASMTCPNDENILTADPWIIRWTKDPMQTEGGVCRAAGIP
jgi:hypothetical protein